MSLNDRLKERTAAVKRRGADVTKAKQRRTHFEKIAVEQEKKRKAAKKDGRDKNAATAKKKAQRATKKAAYWDEQVDDLTDGFEQAKKKKANVKKKIAYQRQQQSPASGHIVPNRSWNPSRRPICGWMIPIIDEAHSRGWRGQITSGVRTPAYSTQLCYGICGRPSCPGLCAGANSNHNATSCAKPQGAIDLTDYYTFGSIMRQMGNPLRNNLPSDRVHYSASGN